MARTSKKEFGHIYGEVNSAEDVRRINRKIRKEMEAVTTREELTELKKRSDYLCTLTYSPSWRKRFGEKAAALRRVAMEENRRTVEHANRIAAKHGWEADYDPWGPNEPRRGATRERPSGGRARPRASRGGTGQKTSRVRTHYKPTTARYSGGGKVKYLVYRSPQPLRTGAIQLRTRVKRLYFPKDARRISMERPKMVATRSGKRVYGVLVRYETRLSAARARRNSTTYTLPERWVERTKVARLPRIAKGVRLTDRAPEGPLLAVA
jgi:predicted GIY-YIG superfamily endonuclease